MSTNSSVAVVMSDGSVKQIYGHWDGYVVGGVGEMLFNYYNTQEKAEELVNSGDFSSLGKYIATKEEHSFDYPEKDVTVFYGHDRSDNWNLVKPTEFENLEDFLDWRDIQDYDYLFVNGEWRVMQEDNYLGTVKHFLNSFDD